MSASAAASAAWIARARHATFQSVRDYNNQTCAQFVRESNNWPTGRWLEAVRRFRSAVVRLDRNDLVEFKQFSLSTHAAHVVVGASRLVALYMRLLGGLVADSILSPHLGNLNGVPAHGRWSESCFKVYILS